ncbi:MAG: DotG/IcmE/VirB10 family protein [Azospirillum sp.]|nr:DotG/IcmE/VirB10 family protein [Azospirillum sp.]
MKFSQKRFILVGGVLVAVAASAAAFMLSPSTSPVGTTQLSQPRNVDIAPGGIGQIENPAFREVQIELDTQRAQQAQRQGGTSLAVPAPVPVPVQVPPAETPALPAVAAPSPTIPPAPAFDPMAGAPMPLQQPVFQSSGVAADAELRAQMRAFLTTESTMRPTAPASTLRSYAADTPPAARSAETVNSPTGSQSGAPRPQCVARAAGRIDYATMINAVRSTQPGPVLAEVLGGPFAGARLLGAFERQDEALFLRFTQLALPTETISIEAVAVSPTTSETAVASYVDRHIFSRFILPVAAQFVAGFGQAVARAGTVTSTSAGPLGTTSTTTPTRNLNTREQLFSAAGTAGQTAAEIFREGAPTGPTVGINRNEPLGIMWLRAVPGPC